MNPETVINILDRLSRFECKLEQDGNYVDSNTVWLAIQTIKQLWMEQHDGKGANIQRITTPSLW
jgi:lipopolysaccharide/colanic/teichoic acid biosynthesis glycosyltransferase